MPTTAASINDWGEAGFAAAERAFGFNALAVPASKTSHPEHSVDAIPGCATAQLQPCSVAGCKRTTFIPTIRAHQDAHGLATLQVLPARGETTKATRLDPDDPRGCTGRPPACSARPQSGRDPAQSGRLAGERLLCTGLGLPTIWVAHSYPPRSRQAPDEQLLADVAAQGVALMARLFTDLGTGLPPGTARFTDGAATQSTVTSCPLQRPCRSTTMGLRKTAS